MGAMSRSGPAAYPMREPVGIGFGKAVQDNGTFAHTGQRGNADVFRAVKDDLLIDFVADDDEVMFDRQIRDALQRFARINRSCGVLGRVDEDELGLRGDMTLQNIGFGWKPLACSVGTNTGTPLAMCTQLP